MASKDLTTTDFQIALPTSSQIAQLQNLSWTETLSRFDLESVRVAGVNIMRQPLRGIIVHVQRTRAFYGEQLIDRETGELVTKVNRDAREGTPPACASDDGFTGHGVPGGSCFDCPLSNFGSDSDSGAAACREFRILYVATGGFMPVVFPVPPTGLKAFRAYFRDLLPLDLTSVVTEIDLEPAQNRGGISYNRPTFKALGQVSADQVEHARAYADAIGKVLA